MPRRCPSNKKLHVSWFNRLCGQIFFAAHPKLYPAVARQLLLVSWQFMGSLGSEICTFSAGECKSVLFFANQRLSVKVETQQELGDGAFQRGKVQLITFRK